MNQEKYEELEPKGRLGTSTRFGYQRTFLALERTQMAWVRTGLSLISFGFGIAKFFQYLQQNHEQHLPALGPRAVGMTMIAIGLVSLTVANFEHRKAMVELKSEFEDLPRSTAGATAAVIMVLGVAAFLAAMI